MTDTNPDLMAVALRHSTAEGAFDMAETLATLEGEPVYELFPVGLKMVGMDMARRYYEHYFAEVAPRIVHFELIGRWTNDRGILEEYAVTHKADGAEPKTYRIMGLLKFGKRLLAGERIWADEELLRIMFTPVWDELEPASG
jgi:hypothetical protein